MVTGLNAVVGILMALNERASSGKGQFVETAPGETAPPPELQSSKSGGKWKWVVLGIAAGAGAGAGVYFGRNNTPDPISISTGTVVFGTPR